jgi:autotransporter-associated beta strand protein
LEGRAAPAVINWSGGPTGAGTNWLDPTNWVGGVLPGPADDAVITNPHGLFTSITLSGTAAVHSVDTPVRALTITAGSLTIGPGQSRFGPGLLLNGGTLVPLDGASISGGDISGTNSLTIPDGVNVNMDGSRVHNTLVNNGALSLTGQVQFSANGVSDVNTGTLNVMAGATLSIGGSSFTLVNSGAVNVAAGGTFQPVGGQYIQSAGMTTVNGTMTAGPVLQGGVLAGTGAVAGFTQTAGTLSPGNPGGILTINGSYSLSGGTIAVALNGPAVGSRGELKATGGVILGGALGLNVGYVASPGDTYVIVDNGGAGPVSGQFTGLPEGATLTSGGQTFRISYVGGDGNDVALNRLPSATDALWDGAPDGGGASSDANWTTASNWVGDAAPVAGNDLYFPAAAAQKMNVNTFPAGTAFHSITFTGGGYAVSGNGIALSGGLRDAATGNNRFDPDIALAGSQVFSVAAAGETLALGGAISGGAGVSLGKEVAGATTLNAGILRFDGTVGNTFAGTLTVNGGTLELNKSGTVAVAGPLVIGDGVSSEAVVELAGDQVADTAAVTIHAGGVLSVGFGDTIGTLTINAGGSVTTWASTLTVTGPTAIIGLDAADILAVTAMSPFAATFDGAPFSPIIAAGGVTFDGGGGSDTLVGPSADTTWSVTGPGGGNLGGPVPFAFANVENLTGGTGNDTFAFTASGNVSGMVDGGGGTNALDYSAIVTPVHANLGLDMTATATLLQPIQTPMSLPFQDVGSAMLTYHAATGTFDLSATINQQSSSMLQPFKLTGPSGTILDLLTVSGATYSLVLSAPSHFTFTYSATSVALPLAYEAALFADQLSVGGVAFGLLVRQTQTAAASGTATGAGGISHIANVTGGSDDDGLVGSAGDNHIQGGDGNDTIVGGPGNDTLLGGAGNDELFWSHGDGSAAVDGQGGSDSVVVNGPLGGIGSGVLVEPGSGGRLAVRPSDLDPVTLDIGTVEALTVIGGGGDTQAFTVNSLAGVTGVGSLNLVGNKGRNVFNVTPSPNVTVNVDGGAPPYPFFVTNSGTLNVNTAGATGAALQVALTYAYGGFAAGPSLHGTYSFGDRLPVNFQNVGFVTPVVSDPSIVVSSAGHVTASRPVTYTIVVSNTRPGLPAGLPETGIVVTDTFPVVLSGVTYTSVATGGATGNTAAGSGNINDTVNLPVGGAITYTVTGTLSPTATGTLSNTATVTVPANDTDLNPANNSSTDTRTIQHLMLRPAVVGAGPGGAPLVNVYDQATGALRFSFDAYDAKFRGGVRVATADLTGDGVPDIITAPGPGGGPHVRIFNGVTGQQLAAPFGSFYAFAPGFTGGVFVAAGDVNGDGMPDIIVGAGAGGGPHVKVFSGANGSLLASFYAYHPNFRGGVTVAAGDVNNDGKVDIVTGAGPGGGPQVKVFSGANLSVLASFYAYSSASNGGVFVAAGDVNADGSADIVTGTGAGSQPVVKAFSGAALAAGGTLAADAVANPLASFTAYDPALRGGVTVALAPRLGVGALDLVAGIGFGGGSRVKAFDGITATALDSFDAFDPSFLGGVFVG